MKNNKNTLDLSVVILTYNEEIHIQRCIDNIKGIARKIYIVDSFSTDNTVLIAQKNNVDVFQHIWENNYAKQLNWGLDNLPINTEWILRLDADELLTSELINELKCKLPLVQVGINGIILKRRYIFLGKWIKRGIYPVKLLRIFRYNKGRCEQRWMDEHIQLINGKTVEFDHDFIDHNLNDLQWWVLKHLNYAKREAIDLLDIEYNILGNAKIDREKQIGKQAFQKRKVKHIYCRQPLFFRAFIYFFYRYFLKMGFFDGLESFLLHFLQGWWYRTMVDYYIYEIKKKCGKNKERMISYIKEKYNLDLGS